MPCLCRFLPLPGSMKPADTGSSMFMVEDVAVDNEVGGRINECNWDTEGQE